MLVHFLYVLLLRHLSDWLLLLGICFLAERLRRGGVDHLVVIDDLFLKPGLFGSGLFVSLLLIADAANAFRKVGIWVPLRSRQLFELQFIGLVPGALLIDFHELFRSLQKEFLIVEPFDILAAVGGLLRVVERLAQVLRFRQLALRERALVVALLKVLRLQDKLDVLEVILLFVKLDDVLPLVALLCLAAVVFDTTCIRLAELVIRLLGLAALIDCDHIALRYRQDSEAFKRVPLLVLLTCSSKAGLQHRVLLDLLLLALSAGGGALVLQLLLRGGVLVCALVFQIPQLKLSLVDEFLDRFLLGLALCLEQFVDIL